jgi:uncharacterized membrane protein YozB (DUF420 family)
VSIHDLPPINAILNGISAILLVAALIAIKRRKIRAHAYLILIALVTSAAFLTCYLIYHAHVKTTKVAELFPHVSGSLRSIYIYVILLPHTLLAVGMLPLIGISLYNAYHRRWAVHRKIGPWTFGIWLYVSVTGVMIYALLYHIFPALERAST